MMNKRKLTVIGGIAAGVVVLAGAGAATVQYVRSNNPETILYSALAEEETDEASIREQSAAGSASKAVGIGYSNRDGIYKYEGEFECKGTSELGTTTVGVTMRQIQEEFFFKYNKITTVSDDAAADAEFQAFADPAVDKWVASSDFDPHVKGYKEKGVWFNLLGVSSKKHTQQKITELLKKHRVITILSSSEKTHNGKPAIEYDIEVRRSAYEKFMDAVQPGFTYKDDVLDTLFAEKTEEMTLLVDKKDKTIVKTSYTMHNVCIDFMSTFDESVAYEMPGTMRIESAPANDDQAKNLTKPEGAISQEEFDTLVYGEETIEE